MAAFLAGALLTILLPIGLLIALGAWYWLFSVRVPDTAMTRETSAEAPAANPGPSIPEALPPEPAP
jgi:hypothetical protein